MARIEVVFAAGLAIVAVIALAQLALGWLEIPDLADVPSTPPPGTALPTVSIVVAARDEERHIADAVRSLLALDYPDCEIVVVDDRSTDATPAILDAIRREHPRLRVVRVDTLPSGWLGKNHALHAGATHASGTLLLFTDADIVFTPDALARAVRLMETMRVDHLAVAPHMILPTWPLALVVNYFMMWFLLWLKPWKAADPRSRQFIGIGAFNLVRASAYRAIGGHERIALRPDDDLMLGKLLKDAGYRQLLAEGERVMRVEWYRTLGEMARGFRKNAFAGMRYSVTLTVAALLGSLAIGVWPFIAVWWASGLARWLYAVTAIAQMLGYVGPAVTKRSRPWLAFLYPLASLLFTGIVAAATTRTLVRRGIEWRGTFYPLDELRANRL
jgi:glycosyltransferase involved in cell wall biosynthesis